MTVHERDQRGFTLTEIMVTLSILGIVLAFAVPGFRSSLTRAQFEGVTTELQSDLRLAISTAKSTGRAVLLDFRADGYRLIDATDTSRVYRTRDLASGIRLNASGSPLVFPWGMVQPASISVTGPYDDEDYQILPTGRLELAGGSP